MQERTRQRRLVSRASKGKILVNRGGLTGKPIEDLTDDDREWLDDEIDKALQRQARRRGHMENFFDCVKTAASRSPMSRSHRNASTPATCANLAMLLGRKLKFDTKKYEFPGDAEANKLAKRVQREPYAIHV